MSFAEKSWKTAPVAIPFIFAICLICYYGTFHYPFHFDDESFITQNTGIRDLSRIGDIWSINPPRFFTYLSLAINYHFGELDVFGYHIFNFGIHFINSILVWRLAGLISSIGWNRPEFGGGYFDPSSPAGRLFPIFVASLFACHPIQTQAVTYIWQRNASLATTFYLLSLTLYLLSAIWNSESGGAGKGKLALGGSVVAAVAGMLTKQNVITLPVAIFMLEYFFISGSIKAMNEKASRLALFLPAFMIVPVLTALGLNQEITHIGVRAKNVLSWYEYLLTQFNVHVTYLRLMFWPVDQNLDYDYPHVHNLSGSWISLLLLVIIFGFGIAMFRKNRIICFGIMFYVLAHSVESSIFPLEDIVFEHRMYLPSFGFFLAFSAILFIVAIRFSGKHATGILAIILIIVMIPLSVAARARNLVWGDYETLWKDVVAKSPGKARGFNNLGVFYIDNGQLDEAEKNFAKALEINPSDAFAHANMALIWDKRGDFDKAVGLLKESVRLDPTFANGYFTLGKLYYRQGMMDAAIQYYRIAAGIEPENMVDVLINLCAALANKGYVDDAIAVCRDAFRRQPANPIANANLGKLLEAKGDMAGAELYKNRARKLGYKPQE